MPKSPFRVSLLGAVLALTFLGAGAAAAETRAQYLAFRALANFEGGTVRVECLLAEGERPELRTTITLREGAGMYDEAQSFRLSRGSATILARKIADRPSVFRHDAVRAEELREVTSFLELVSSVQYAPAPGTAAAAAHVPLRLQVGENTPGRRIFSAGHLSTVAMMCQLHFAETYLSVRGSRDVRAMIALNQQRDGTCRGSGGDDPATIRACEARDALGLRLNELGQCYGRDNEAGFEMRWHACGPSSTRSPFSR